MRNAAIFSEWFGVGVIAGRVCAALFAADTSPMTVADLRARLGHAPLSIRAALIALRDAAEGGEVITDGVRYALTELGCEDCNAALEDARQRGVAA